MTIDEIRQLRALDKTRMLAQHRNTLKAIKQLLYDATSALSLDAEYHYIAEQRIAAVLNLIEVRLNN